MCFFMRRFVRCSGAAKRQEAETRREVFLWAAVLLLEALPLGVLPVRMGRVEPIYSKLGPWIPELVEDIPPSATRSQRHFEGCKFRLPRRCSMDLERTPQVSISSNRQEEN
jgi:hypothetical protein